MAPTEVVSPQNFAGDSQQLPDSPWADLQRRRAAGRTGKNGCVDYDETAPVLALVIDPDSETALLRPMSLNVSGTIAATIEGSIEAVEIDGGSVLWVDASGKDRRLATNLLATKIAHRLNAGLFPDDTINGRALVVGETTGPSGDLVSADVSPATLAALKRLGIEVQPG